MDYVKFQEFDGMFSKRLASYGEREKRLGSLKITYRYIHDIKEAK